MDKAEKIELEYYELCPECGKEAYGFCNRADGTEGNYIVTFNNKEDLQPIEVTLPM